MSGLGLHVIIWLNEPVEFATDGERQRWAGIVKTIQGGLPADPDMPGMTALTRARGSINSKNGVKVRQLVPGRPVTKELVMSLYEQLRVQPFKTVMTILFGKEKVAPCPVCDKEGTMLSARNFFSRCYGSCGKVTMEKLYDVFLEERSTLVKEE